MIVAPIQRPLRIGAFPERTVSTDDAGSTPRICLGDSPMRTSKLGLTAATFTAMMLAVTVAASTASAHELKSNGSPSALDDDRSGYFVWNDDHDVHVEMQSSDSSTDYRGTLHTDGKFRDVNRNDDDNDMRTWTSDDGHTLHFHSVPGDDRDGFKVRVEDSNHVDLDLKRNGDSAPTDRIWVGNDNDHPDDHNFTLHI
jgi:hypothetical protein